MVTDELRALMASLGVNFNDEALLLQAFTHLSVCAQNDDTEWESYETLEWPGDAVLALILREWLLERKTALSQRFVMYGYFASNYFLSFEVAKPLKLVDHLRVTERGMPRPSQLYKLEGDLVEAIIYAVKVDQGFEAAERFVRRIMTAPMERAIETGLYDPIKLLRKKADAEPQYTVVDRHGDLVNGYQFVATVKIGEDRSQVGLGPRPNIARMNAAKSALAEYHGIQLKDEEDDP